MLVEVWARSKTLLMVLVAGGLLSGVGTAQPVDPTAVADVSTPIRAAGSFVLVLLLGGAFLTLSAGFVDRSVDASMDSPLGSILYGALAQVTLVLLGVYAISQLASLGSVGPTASFLGVWIAAIAWLVAASLGFAIVGVGLTDAAGDRQPWSGLAIGATVAAFVWVLPTVLLASLASIAVVSLGIGGPTKRWVHASIEGDADLEADA